MIADASALDPRLAGLGISATLSSQSRCRERAAKGLAVGRLGLGQSPFPVPDGVVAALRAAASEKEYLPVHGLPALRDAVAEYHARRHGISRAGNDVMIAPGSKELMFLLQIAFAGELIVPAPAWVSYVPQARLAGRSVHVLATSWADGYRLTPKLLDAACRARPRRPKLLVLNYPANPTGVTYREHELAALAEVARRHGLIVLSDEIYGELDHAGRHVSIAKFHPDATIISSGLSKWCGAGGWRLGTFSFPSGLRWLLDALAVVASETYTSTCAPVQHAAVHAFRGGAEIEEYLARSRRILVTLTESSCAHLVAAGAHISAPEAGFYLFPGFAAHRRALAQRGISDDRALAERLLVDTGVATLPGSSFGLDPSALRLRLALVDFDGARALAAAATEAVDTAFAERYCAPTLHAVATISGYVEDP